MIIVIEKRDMITTFIWNFSSIIIHINHIGFSWCSKLLIVYKLQAETVFSRLIFVLGENWDFDFQFRPATNANSTVSIKKNITNTRLAYNIIIIIEGP